MYTLETDELYNRLVPWGIERAYVVVAGYKKRTVWTCPKNHFAVLQISLRGDRNAELLETSQSNPILMNTMNELDGFRVQLPELQTVD